MIISKKVCLLGDFAVGKTSLVRRFIYNLFDDRYLSTIGVKVSRKTVDVPIGDDLLELNLMIWDLAGSDEFNQARKSYLRGAAGALLVCDLTRPQTLSSLQAYAADLLDMNPDARFVVAANKRDLIDQVAGGAQYLTAEQVEECAGVLDAPWALTSARTGDEVETLFRNLAGVLVGAPEPQTANRKL
jgi:small GTP-binding protein